MSSAIYVGTLRSSLIPVSSISFARSKIVSAASEQSDQSSDVAQRSLVLATRIKEKRRGSRLS